VQRKMATRNMSKEPRNMTRNMPKETRNMTHKETCNMTGKKPRNMTRNVPKSTRNMSKGPRNMSREREARGVVGR
jgi:hypothetical protein